MSTRHSHTDRNCLAGMGTHMHVKCVLGRFRNTRQTSKEEYIKEGRGEEIGVNLRGARGQNWGEYDKNALY